MLGRAAAIAAVSLLAIPVARASGGERCARVVDLQSQPGGDLVVAATTFGILASNDGGASFHWVCEEALGYGGTFIPDLAVTGDGRIYATTFDGMKVSRDGSCSYQPAVFYPHAPGDEPGEPAQDPYFVGDVEVAADGSLWAVSSSTFQPNAVYRSTDGERFFAVGLLSDTVWWKSVVVAPSDPQVAYVSGLEPMRGEADAGGAGRALLRRTDDGGATWTELDVDDFDFGVQPNLEVIGVSPTDPDLVFARVIGVNPGTSSSCLSENPVGDALYRSTDGGETFTRALDFGDVLGAFVIRADGATVIAGSRGLCPEDAPGTIKGCVRISRDGGATWTAPATEPQMDCVAERGDGTLYACGADPGPDGFAVGESADGERWTNVMRVAEIAGPLSCAEDTVQNTCAVHDWPGECSRLHVCDSGEADGGVALPICPEGRDCDDTCGCRAGEAAGGLLALLALFPLVRRSRRRA